MSNKFSPKFSKIKIYCIGTIQEKYNKVTTVVEKYI